MVDLMMENLDDLDPVDAYIAIYNEVQELKAELAALEKRRKEAQDAVVNHIRRQGYTTVKRQDKQVVLSDRTYPKVEDFDALEDWVDKQDEPRSEYMEEVFRKEILGDMIRQVRKKYPGQEAMYLPAGLSFYTKIIVTVRKVAVPKESDGSAKSRLAEMIGDKHD